MLNFYPSCCVWHVLSKALVGHLQCWLTETKEEVQRLASKVSVKQNRLVGGQMALVFVFACISIASSFDR